MIASDRCNQLARALLTKASHSIVEDIQAAARQIAQCSANVMDVGFSLTHPLSPILLALRRRRMVHCSNASRRSSSTSIVPTNFPTTMTLTSTHPGPTSVYRSVSHPLRPHALSLLVVDLFAHEGDFSWNTIQQRRNLFYQQQMAARLGQQCTDTLALLTSALDIHLTLGQTSVINTSAIVLSLETMTAAALPNKIIQPVGLAQIRLPSLVLLHQSSLSLRVRLFSVNLFAR